MYLEQIVSGLRKRIRIVCLDGFVVSIQAGKSIFCQPRNNQGPYSSLEIYFLGADHPELEKYSNGNGVYGFVPVEAIRTLIDAHGGESHLVM
jgi:hypothetical protein